MVPPLGPAPTWSWSPGWVWLGYEGREINAILAGARGEWAQMEAWKKHLQQVLKFPFAAEVSEWQGSRSALQTGQKVRVTGIEDLDDHYGVLVEVKKGREYYVFPLCDLKALPGDSVNRDPVQLYAVWFANR